MTPNSLGAIRSRALTSVIRSGSPAFEDLPGGGLGDRQAHAAHRLDVAGAGLHDQLVAVAQHDHEAACADEGASALDDQLEHVLERDLSADRDGDVAGRLQAANRPLGLIAATLAGLIQAGVVDRDGSPVGEDHRGLLVALGELAALLLGQVEVAPRLPAESGPGLRGSCASTGCPAGNP